MAIPRVASIVARATYVGAKQIHSTPSFNDTSRIAGRAQPWIGTTGWLADVFTTS